MIARRSLFPSGLPPGVAGDPGVVGPGGTVWRVVREKAVVAGGPAALLLQVAHPRVAAGVVDHSDFETDPLGRLRRTLDTMLTVGFGDHAQAQAAVAGVKAVHAHVRGPSYRADDPELALWVHTTLVVVALDVYDDFVGRLSVEERADYYERTKVIGRLFGVTDDTFPPTYGDFVAYVRRMEDEVLTVGDAARAVAAGIFGADVVGPRWLSRPAMELAAGARLPPALRHAFGIRWGRGRRATYRLIRALVRPGLRLLPGRARYWQHYRVARSRIGVD